MPENAPEYSIARDYDPTMRSLSADSDPMAAYLADVTGGAVENMGFTVDDSREHINSLKQRRRVPFATSTRQCSRGNDFTYF